MRVIAVIDDPRVVEKLLRHLGAWQDPPPRPPPAGVASQRPFGPRFAAKLPRLGNDIPIFVLRIRENRSKTGKNYLSTVRQPFDKTAPYLVRPKNQFSLTRAALSACGRAKSKYMQAWAIRASESAHSELDVS